MWLQNIIAFWQLQQFCDAITTDKFTALQLSVTLNLRNSLMATAPSDSSVAIELLQMTKSFGGENFQYLQIFNELLKFFLLIF